MQILILKRNLPGLSLTLKLLTWLEVHEYHFNSQYTKSVEARPVECIVYHVSNDMVLEQSQNLILRVKRDFSKIMNPLALFKLEMIISPLSTRIFIILQNWTKNIQIEM